MNGVRDPRMLAFDSVEKRYPDGTVALRSVSMQVPQGEFCVILGPSGAGKSTLLRMVNGLVAPTGGSIVVDGIPVEEKTLPRIRPRIGMIHQQFNLVLRSSVATNILSGALPAISTWRAVTHLFPERYRRRTCELVAAVGLGEEHLRRRVSGLSGGQQQRVGIARAFMLDPAIVLADEPVASLDPKISRDILSLLKRESRDRGTTVLCSLHQMDLAREFADRIVALRGGEVAFDGEPADLDEAATDSIYGEIIAGDLLIQRDRPKIVARA
ncbi:phosphonate ABC transporter ATP-binding protein [Virgifigura deserti]|uniref:phosphonate ABC transporter ATP-binding protein n=1 Tax=Virgifigura deserti TaxID=2268457 RepID=UPI003CCBA3E9